MDEGLHGLLPPVSLHLSYYWNLNLSRVMSARAATAFGEYAALGIAFDTPVSGGCRWRDFSPCRDSTRGLRSRRDQASWTNLRSP